MLGDGSISLFKKTKGNGTYAMTMDVYSLNYLIHLYENIYSKYTETKIYPDLDVLLPLHKDKEVTQYQFKTKTQPLYTELQGIWYRLDNKENKYLKIFPSNIFEIFS